jgi:hypothetical protein
MLYDPRSHRSQLLEEKTARLREILAGVTNATVDLILFHWNPPLPLSR